MSDLHPYDNRERRFVFDDDTRAEGLVWVAKLLQLPRAPSAARFDLRFFSGGIGIIDRLAIAIPATRDEAARIAATCGFGEPDQADYDVMHLVHDEDEPKPFDHEVVAFIAQHRTAFQPDVVAGAAVWIEPGSGVNHWNLMWHAADQLAFLGYDQG